MVSFNSLSIMDEFLNLFSSSFLFALRKLLLFHIILSLELSITLVDLCVWFPHASKDTEINSESKSCSYFENGSSVAAASAVSNILLRES